jgi:crossover junction endodeoxyribonuclease RuvC
MTVLGIDPGLSSLGYGIIETTDNDQELKLKDYGCITTDKYQTLSKRLLKIYNELTTLIKFTKPDIIALEEIFFFKNKKTVISIGQVEGVIILAAVTACNNIKIYQYSPTQIKQRITNFGKATKLQLQYMVKTLLNLESLPIPTHTADALAVALCHILSSKDNIIN